MIWVVSALLLVLIIGGFVWIMCAAAKRGDEMTESCTEFDMAWRDMPLDEVVAELRAITKAHNVNFDGFNPETREWEPRP